MLRPDRTSSSARRCSSERSPRSSSLPTAAALLSALLASAPGRLETPREKPLAAGATLLPGPLRKLMTLLAAPTVPPSVLSERGARGRRAGREAPACPAPVLPPRSLAALFSLPAQLPPPTPAQRSRVLLTLSLSRVRASGSAPLMLSWMHLDTAGQQGGGSQVSCRAATRAASLLGRCRTAASSHQVWFRCIAPAATSIGMPRSRHGEKASKWGLHALHTRTTQQQLDSMV